MIRLITVLVLLSTLVFSTEQLAEECNAKSGESYYKLGDSYIMGKNGLKQDRQKAVELYKQACDCKYGEACNLLGFFANDSDVNLSLAYYDKGCEYGYEFSCFRAADINIKGVGREESGGRIDINASKALEYRIKACDLNAGNCSAVAYLYETGYEGVPKDMDKAMEYYKRKCDGYDEAFDTCQRVGYAYEIGEGIPKDFKIASEYYAKACKNDPLGWVCYRAKATRIMAETKEDSVIKAFEKACDVTKEAIACSSIARMYELGWSAYDDIDYFYDYRAVQIDLEFPKAEVAPKDIDKALKYYTKACKYGGETEDNMDCFRVYRLLKQIKAQETNASIK